MLKHAQACWSWGDGRLHRLHCLRRCGSLKSKTTSSFQFLYFHELLHDATWCLYLLPHPPTYGISQSVTHLNTTLYHIISSWSCNSNLHICMRSKTSKLVWIEVKHGEAVQSTWKLFEAVRCILNHLKCLWSLYSTSNSISEFLCIPWLSFHAIGTIGGDSFSSSSWEWQGGKANLVGT